MLTTSRKDRNARVIDATLLGGLLIAGSFLARWTIDEAWEAVRDEPPPDPDDPDTELRDAVLWSVASGLLVGLVRLLLRRQFARVRDPDRSALDRALRKLR